MKVAYLLGTLNRGGTETLLLDCFNNASKAGYSFIGVHRKGGNLLANFISSGIPVFHLGFRHKLDITYFFRLRKLLINQSVSIAHAQQPLDALLAWIALKGTGIKVVLTLHGFDFEKDQLSVIINRIILSRTALNIYVSEAVRTYYQAKFKLKKDKQKVIYNGISFEKLSVFSGNNIRNEFRIPTNALLLCSVGNFVPGRDQLTICKFLTKLKSQYPDFRMIFAGARSETSPELFDQCVSFCRSNQLEEHVFFPGSRYDIPDILNQSDAFIYASDHDTFGIAVIEAIASGLPVFVNDWEVIKEITDGGTQANLYKTKSAEDLLINFVDYVKNVEIYKQKAIQAAEWAKGKYSIQSHLSNLRQAYTLYLSINE